MLKALCCINIMVLFLVPHSFLHSLDIAHGFATCHVDTYDYVILIFSLLALRLQGLICRNCVHLQLPLLSVGCCFEHLICCIILSTPQNQVLCISDWMRKLVGTLVVCICVPQFSVCKMEMTILSDDCESEAISLSKTLKSITDEYQNSQRKWITVFRAGFK